LRLVDQQPAFSVFCVISICVTHADKDIQLSMHVYELRAILQFLYGTGLHVSLLHEGKSIVKQCYKISQDYHKWVDGFLFSVQISNRTVLVYLFQTFADCATVQLICGGA